MVSPGQVPIAFAVPYGTVGIDPQTTYTVQATIIDGERIWATGQGTPVITKGAPSSGLDIQLVYRTDLLKGAVTGSISGTDIELGPEAMSAAVLLDVATDTTMGIDVEVAPAGVPIAFSVAFDPAKIDQSAGYVVAAGIVDGDQRWENRTGVPVITKGNPLSGITVPVTTTSDVVADDGLQLGAIVGLLGIIALIVAAVLYVRSRREPVTEPPPGGTDRSREPKRMTRSSSLPKERRRPRVTSRWPTSRSRPPLPRASPRSGERAAGRDRALGAADRGWLRRAVQPARPLGRLALGP